MKEISILQLTLFLGGILVVGLLYQHAYGSSLADARSQSGNEPAQNEQSEQWAERIQDVGGKAAYVELSNSISGLSPQLQHVAAHAFGEALYDVEGTKGLAVCDSNYSFGCYHEFLGRAIAALGLSSVNDLNQGCVDALGSGALSCQHGIGHGILAFLGYSDKALLEGLARCKALPYNDPIGGCYGGLFMEYNLETMLNTEGRIRPMTSDPQAPCDTLAQEFRRACYYWQPQWWDQSSKSMPDSFANSVIIFKKMGEWCMSAGENIRDCFEGIGNITAPNANFEPTQAIKLCEAISDSKTYQLYCKSVAANSLSLGGAGKKGDGVAVCTGLTGNELEYCTNYAKNTFNIVHQGVLPNESQ